MLQGLAATSANEECHTGNYKLLSTIGPGNIIKEKLAWHILTGTDVAVKVNKSQQISSNLQGLLCEDHCMKALNYPNKLLKVTDTEETLFLIMEYNNERHV